MASSLNVFVLFCGVLICQWGLIPRRTKSCEESDPAEQDPAGYQTPAEPSLEGYQTPQNNDRDLYILVQTLVLRVLIPHRTMSCGALKNSAKQSPAGYQTPRNKVLWGFTPRGTTLKTNISANLRQNSKIFRVWIRGLYGVDSWKKLKLKNLVLLSLERDCRANLKRLKVNWLNRPDFGEELLKG